MKYNEEMLVPCPACARHVRTNETACPFCDRELPADLAASAVPGTKLRLSRAAFFTFATTLGVFGVLANGCGGDIAQSADGADTENDASYGSVDSAYGGSNSGSHVDFDANYGLNDAGFDEGTDDIDAAETDDAADE